MEETESMSHNGYRLIRRTRGQTIFPISPAMAMSVVLYMMLLYASAVALAADNRNPFAGNAKAAKAGASEFRINCALCHGLGARGGGRGPDLTRAQKKHAHSDAEMFQIISNGIPGTAMPANGTNGQGVGMTDEEIWQIITYIRSQEVKAPAQQIGNVGHGKELFYGDANCSLCHMVEGKGGRLGPDELHDSNCSNDRAARPEGRAKIAFGVTSCTPASETFAGRGTLASAPLLSTRRL